MRHERVHELTDRVRPPRERPDEYLGVSLPGLADQIPARVRQQPQSEVQERDRREAGQNDHVCPTTTNHCCIASWRRSRPGDLRHRPIWGVDEGLALLIVGAVLAASIVVALGAARTG